MLHRVTVFVLALFQNIQSFLILSLSVQDIGVLKTIVLLLTLDGFQSRVKILGLDECYNPRLQRLVLALVNLKN